MLSQLQSFARMAHTGQQPKQTSHPLSALFWNFENEEYVLIVFFFLQKPHFRFAISVSFNNKLRTTFCLLCCLLPGVYLKS